MQNWRQTYFGTTASAGDAADGADPDGDGWTNAQEFVAGTIPIDRTSAFRVTQVQTSGSDVLVSFPSVVGRNYRLERSDTLHPGSWTTVQDNIAGTGATLHVTDVGAASQPKRFCRVVIP